MIFLQDNSHTKNKRTSKFITWPTAGHLKVQLLSTTFKYLISTTSILLLGFRTQRVKRDPNAKTPLSICPFVTRLYLVNRDSYTDDNKN